MTSSLVSIQMKKQKICLNKPIFSGMAILDLSKTLINYFHYNWINEQDFESKLLFTDTDSLCYHIMGDIEKAMKKDSHLFDFSNYEKDHPLYDPTNKKVIGEFRNECPNDKIVEFVGLR